MAILSFIAECLEDGMKGQFANGIFQIFKRIISCQIVFKTRTASVKSDSASVGRPRILLAATNDDFLPTV
jgi:hypothetical protein